MVNESMKVINFSVGNDHFDQDFLKFMKQIDNNVIKIFKYKFNNYQAISKKLDFMLLLCQLCLNQKKI